MLHHSLHDLLAESLPEYLEMADVAIHTRKPGGSARYCYGYPAAALLFSIANAIGSYASHIEVKIDGRRHKIGRMWIRVLNSRFYGQFLTGHQL